MSNGDVYPAVLHSDPRSSSSKTPQLFCPGSFRYIGAELLDHRRGRAGKPGDFYLVVHVGDAGLDKTVSALATMLEELNGRALAEDS